MNRPYEFVPTVAIMMLIDIYTKLINDGDFKKQKDLDLMLQELKIRFNYEEDKQITIEEYMRSRKNE